MITVVSWLWGDKYGDHVVRVLQAAVARNISVPHRFVCITDRPSIPGVECYPMPKRPPGARAESIRLWLFSRQARNLLGNNLLNLDIDLVITGALDGFATDPAEFKIWRSDSTGPHGYALNPSVMLVRGECMQPVWDKFRKSSERMLKEARSEGWTGTEQAVIARHFQERAPLSPPVWTFADGILSMRKLLEVFGEDGLVRFNTDSARIVSFHGRRQPADFLHVPWVARHWRC